MVCAQKLPPCGSFDTAESAMLPALQQVCQSMNNTSNAGCRPLDVDRVRMDQMVVDDRDWQFQGQPNTIVYA
jgi:hypothetical protein